MLARLPITENRESSSMQWTRTLPHLRAFWGIIQPPSLDVAPSVSEPYSFGFNFSGNDALVAIEGRTEARTLPAMTGGMNGAERIEWIGLEGPAECASIRTSEGLRQDVAEETGAAGLLDLDDTFGHEDAVFSAVALRLRAAGRGGWEMTALELDEFVRAGLRQLAVTRYGGTLRSRGRERIDAARLARVSEYISAHISDRILLDDLASVAAMSPFHFQRAFSNTTGLSPNRFLMAMRMDRAAALIRAGASRSKAAHAVGYTPGHAFRARLERHEGL